MNSYGDYGLRIVHAFTVGLGGRPGKFMGSIEGSVQHSVHRYGVHDYESVAV